MPEAMTETNTPGKGNMSGFVESDLVVSSVSEEATLIFTWVIYSFLCQLIVLFGIATNIINIICFVKQGFKDSINVSLLGLSVSDLGSLITLVLTNICFTPAVREADLTFEPMAVYYLIAAMPHFSFTRVSSWITAMITLERCLCIVAPLKIKNIITPVRSTVITVCVFFILLSSTAPMYVVNKLDMIFSPERNKTIYGLVFMNNRESVEQMSFIINNFTLPVLASIIIVICTIVLVIKLKSASDWRNHSMNQSQAGLVSVRNQRVAKMIVMISTLFIACFIPLCTIIFAVAFEPQLSFGGKHVNAGIMLGGFGFVLESINSSMNIFIYYRMSSKYRKTFHVIFCSRSV